MGSNESPHLIFLDSRALAAAICLDSRPRLRKIRMIDGGARMQLIDILLANPRRAEFLPVDLNWMQQIYARNPRTK